MPHSANVQSLESIENVKSSLVAFSDQVAQSLTILEVEIRRVLDWLEHDRPRYWKSQVHRANEEVAQAQANLHRCLMFPIADERPSCLEERSALKRAKARMAYCEEKVERIRYWIREVHREQFEYEGRMGQLARIAEIDVPRAVGVLNKLLRRLEEYQAIGPKVHGVPYDDVRIADEVFEAPGDKESSDRARTASDEADEDATAVPKKME